MLRGTVLDWAPPSLKLATLKVAYWLVHNLCLCAFSHPVPTNISPDKLVDSFDFRFFISLSYIKLALQLLCSNQELHMFVATQQLH